MVKKFFDYTELRTKITSVFTFFMTVAYLFYKKQPIHFKLTLLFFASMFLFDLTIMSIQKQTGRHCLLSGIHPLRLLLFYF